MTISIVIRANETRKREGDYLCFLSVCCVIHIMYVEMLYSQLKLYNVLVKPVLMVESPCSAHCIQQTVWSVSLTSENIFSCSQWQWQCQWPTLVCHMAVREMLWVGECCLRCCDGEGQNSTEDVSPPSSITDAGPKGNSQLWRLGASPTSRLTEQLTDRIFKWRVSDIIV